MRGSGRGHALPLAGGGDVGRVDVGPARAPHGFRVHKIAVIAAWQRDAVLGGFSYSHFASLGDEAGLEARHLLVRLIVRLLDHRSTTNQLLPTLMSFLSNVRADPAFDPLRNLVLVEGHC